MAVRTSAPRAGCGQFEYAVDAGRISVEGAGLGLQLRRPPIWLGEKSSVATQVIERLYGNSHLLNDSGQYAYYGRTAGCLVTGNEDGGSTAR